MRKISHNPVIHRLISHLYHPRKHHPVKSHSLLKLNLIKQKKGLLIGRRCLSGQKLTQKDPREFGYLSPILYLLQMCLIAQGRLQSWYLDSGCLRHMTWRRFMFPYLQTRDDGGTITLGVNQKGLIIGEGNIGKAPLPIIPNDLLFPLTKQNVLSRTSLR